VHSEERVLPGNLAEMNEFESHASNTARYLITCHLPEVRIHLPSKQFLEALYNRFLNVFENICMYTKYKKVFTFGTYLVLFSLCIFDPDSVWIWQCGSQPLLLQSTKPMPSL